MADLLDSLLAVVKLKDAFLTKRCCSKIQIEFHHSMVENPKFLLQVVNGFFVILCFCPFNNAREK